MRVENDIEIQIPSVLTTRCEQYSSPTDTPTASQHSIPQRPGTLLRNSQSLLRNQFPGKDVLPLHTTSSQVRVLMQEVLSTR